HVDGVAIFVSGSREYRRAGVEHDWDSVGFGGAIDDFKFSDSVQVVVGIEKLVRRMDFDHANLQAQKLLYIGLDVCRVTRVQAAAGNQALGIFFHVVGDELIDSIGAA